MTARLESGSKTPAVMDEGYDSPVGLSQARIAKISAILAEGTEALGKSSLDSVKREDIDTKCATIEKRLASLEAIKIALEDVLSTMSEKQGAAADPIEKDLLVQVVQLREGFLNLIYVFHVLSKAKEENYPLPDTVLLPSLTRDLSFYAAAGKSAKEGDPSFLGAGAMGNVNKITLCKKPVAEKAKDIKETLALLSLPKSRNIVELLGVGKKHIYLVLAENGSLLQACRKTPELLTRTTTHRLLTRIAEGIHFLHQTGEIAHLDLKASNIVLDKFYQPKIADFGKAMPLQRLRVSEATEEVASTPAFFAPEAICPDLPRSEKIDVWHFGSIISELITGGEYLHSVAHPAAMVFHVAFRFKRV